MSSIASVLDLNLTRSSIVSLLFVALLVAFIGAIVCRLYFHPLSKIPGPKLAALTEWYESYWDVVKRGQYTFEIGRMHERYGPIVRVGPNEVHINDPSFIEELYVAGGKKRDKVDSYGPQFGTPDSVFGTAAHDIHRMRRGALNQYFSKASVTKLEPIIKQVVDKLCDKLELHAGTGKPIILSMAISCMTADIVTEYSFARSYNLLDSPTFEPNLHRAIVAGTDLAPFIKRFQWIMTLMKSLPDSIVEKINPEMGVYLKFQSDMKTQIEAIEEGKNTNYTNARAHATIFHELLNGDLPPTEKSLDRLWQEGQTIIGAGTETTAWSVSVAMFYILYTPGVLDRLSHELSKATSGPMQLPDWNTLEQLPYMAGVVQECLRLSYGISTRLLRISPDLPLYYRPNEKSYPGLTTTFEIPAGTPVGMTSTLVHNNPELFPEPSVFKPERWVTSDGKINRQLAKYLLAFSRGSRQCLGINLAYAEMYMSIAAMTLRLGDRLKLFDTTLDDVEIHHDTIVPAPKMGSKGIRVVIEKA
ncbi:MAG: hypothetical protein MMC33_008189 [Icmadophila ericetorum]|nr:hypothetical protein [Icmadophila ericetorum]